MHWESGRLEQNTGQTQVSSAADIFSGNAVEVMMSNSGWDGKRVVLQGKTHNLLVYHLGERLAVSE